MRIILDNGGQTCNKFWCYLAPIESAIKGKKRYSVLFPDKDLEDFPNLLNCHYLHFMFSCVIFRKIFGLKRIEILLRKYIKKFRILDIIIKLRPNMLWESWKDCHFIIEETTRPYIQKIFRPKESIVDSIENLFSQVRKDYDLIIGVHIRRGDYKDFCNGVFFFSFDKYSKICNQIQDEFSDKKCVFSYRQTKLLTSLHLKVSNISLFLMAKLHTIYMVYQNATILLRHIPLSHNGHLFMGKCR